jgi:hypothetical protein
MSSLSPISSPSYKIFVKVYNVNKMLRFTTRKEHIEDVQVNHDIKMVANYLISIILKKELYYANERYYLKPNKREKEEYFYRTPVGHIIFIIDYASL